MQKINTDTNRPLPVSEDSIVNRIYLIRGTQVMLDFDLSGLYEVETKQLKKAVRRNFERFPADFMFNLDNLEPGNLGPDNLGPDNLEKDEKNSNLNKDGLQGVFSIYGRKTKSSL